MSKYNSKVQNRSTKGDEITQELPLACADETAAVEFMEKRRWGSEPGCPKCGDMDVYQMRNRKTGERQENFRWRCRGCGGQYTVRTGTVFEDSRIPLRHWCFAFWRASTSKKGVSALEIHRTTGISYKSALFMLHRIRFAMADSAPEPLKGDVEVDETYVGGKPRYKGQSKRGRGTRKTPVFAMVERGGSVKAQVVPDVTAKTLKGAIRESVQRDSRLLSDEHWSYRGLGNEFSGGHHAVSHGLKEYAVGDIHSNTIESFFSGVKRGLNGIYHAVSKKHLHRYLTEFEFRWNRREMEDGERVAAALLASEGKRLLYKEPISEVC